MWIHFVVYKRLMMVVKGQKHVLWKYFNKLKWFINNLIISLIYWKHKVAVLDGHIYILVTQQEAKRADEDVLTCYCYCMSKCVRAYSLALVAYDKELLPYVDLMFESTVQHVCIYLCELRNSVIQTYSERIGDAIAGQTWCFWMVWSYEGGWMSIRSDWQLAGPSASKIYKSEAQVHDLMWKKRRLTIYEISTEKSLVVFTGHCNWKHENGKCVCQVPPSALDTGDPDLLYNTETL
jgi:hypothetical protein